MKKLRLTIRIITITLLALALTAIILLIINKNLDPLDTSYEIIAFSIGAAAMIMSVIAQIDSYQQEKITKKMIEDLTALNRAADQDNKVDARFQQKLDNLLQINQKIYRKLAKPRRKRS